MKDPEEKFLKKFNFECVHVLSNVVYVLPILNSFYAYVKVEVKNFFSSW
jgi:hypothetical protein